MCISLDRKILYFTNKLNLTFQRLKKKQKQSSFCLTLNPVKLLYFFFIFLSWLPCICCCHNPGCFLLVVLPSQCVFTAADTVHAHASLSNYLAHSSLTKTSYVTHWPARGLGMWSYHSKKENLIMLNAFKVNVLLSNKVQLFKKKLNRISTFYARNSLFTFSKVNDMLDFIKHFLLLFPYLL